MLLFIIKTFFNKSFRKLYKQANLIISDLHKDKEIFPEELHTIAKTKLIIYTENNNLNPKLLNLALDIAILKNKNL